MDKKHNYTNHGKSSKRLWITFLFFCIITTGFMQAANKVFAQATVTASFKNATLSEILWEIQRQTDFTFVYSTNDVKQIKVQNLNVNNEKIANVLDKCLMNSGLTYSVHNGVIAIKQIEEKESAVPQQKTTLTGTVLDETGEPIIGANILVKGTTNGTTTDLDGYGRSGCYRLWYFQEIGIRRFCFYCEDRRIKRFTRSFILQFARR